MVGFLPGPKKKKFGEGHNFLSQAMLSQHHDLVYS